MSDIIVNSITAGELEGAAWLCLAIACNTPYDTFPPGSGEIRHRELHARKRRFENAKKMVEEGHESLLGLGLSADDCKWAASQSESAKDSEAWKAHFEEAEKQLREMERTPIAV